MHSIQQKAFAKINLTLDILGKRDDGYHQVEMVMQSIQLHDDICIEKAESGIKIKTSHPEVPVDGSNLAAKAVRALEELVGNKLPVVINITKRIPVAAGLAGGSSNAAAVLTGVNKLYDLKIPFASLLKLGAQLGSDVPFCLELGTFLAYNKGEKLKKLPNCPSLSLVLVKPPVSVSTAKVYQGFKQEEVKFRPQTTKMIDAIETKNIHEIGNELCNVLENVTLKEYPIVEAIKNRFIDLGYSKVLMSGSGPTVFALVKNQKEGLEIARYFEDLGEVFVTQTYNP